MCAPPLTILAHEGAGLGRGALPSRGRGWVSPILRARPMTPAGEGEERRRGSFAPVPRLACTARHLPHKRGRRVGGEEVSGNVDHPGCWGPAGL
jgi:hypothetical protein